jgi:hypothetical protein
MPLVRRSDLHSADCTLHEEGAHHTTLERLPEFSPGTRRRRPELADGTALSRASDSRR